MIAKKPISKLDSTTPKLALLVGIHYKNTELEMSDPCDDLHRFIVYLTTIGFETDDIIILTDTDAFDNKLLPTSKNILYFIECLTKFAGENQGAYIVFYYTGHGTRVINNNKRHESIVTSDRMTIQGDIIKKKLIDELTKDITVFAFIDCCYSGNIINLKYKYLKNKRFEQNFRDNSICNAYVISSSKNNEISLKYLVELNNKNREKRSLLTWIFFEKYKMNAYLSSLLKNIQIMMQSKFTKMQHVQLSTNRDIDISHIYIPLLKNN